MDLIKTVKFTRIPNVCMSTGDLMCLMDLRIKFEACHFGHGCNSLTNSKKSCPFLHTDHCILIKLKSKLKNDEELNANEKQVKKIIDETKVLIYGDTYSAPKSPQCQPSIYVSPLPDVKNLSDFPAFAGSSELKDSRVSQVSDDELAKVVKLSLEEKIALDAADAEEIRKAVENSLKEKSSDDAKESEMKKVIQLSLIGCNTSRHSNVRDPNLGGGPVGPRIHPNVVTHRNIQIMNDFPSLKFGSLIGRKGNKWYPVQCITVFKISKMSEGSVIEGGFEEYGRYEDANF